MGSSINYVITFGGHLTLYTFQAKTITKTITCKSDILTQLTVSQDSLLISGIARQTLVLSESDTAPPAPPVLVFVAINSAYVLCYMLYFLIFGVHMPTYHSE